MTSPHGWINNSGNKHRMALHKVAFWGLSFSVLIKVLYHVTFGLCNVRNSEVIL